MTQIRHFELELAELKRSMVSMADLVQQLMDVALATLMKPSIEARERARALEDRLDALETAIEERCHTIIALQSPMARDLRFLISATRITADLEQIGDLIESVVKRAHYIARHTPIANPPQVEQLALTATRMIREAMDAFVTGDLDMARRTIADEDNADALTKECYKAIQDAMMANPASIREYTHLLRAASSLEQAADTAVAIAEEAVYIHKGQLVRHNHDELRAQPRGP
ncbi:MAG TPA: phosphate signaling complex protein PhoU [Planctomycetota bacterium]|nr:phosphate signaling complex protein PhoU [Planctomycetota bacterium]